MKLKVCFCNKTVLKTDITRFAPVWASYLLGLAMMVLLQFSGGSDDAAKTSIVYDFNRLCMLGVGINGLYAQVVVQALFGDLLNPRLCNALHAMPVTRDGYYGAHLIAGLLFALVPNCLVLLPTSLLLPRQVASVSLLSLLALSLQYIFYLGTALTAVQLAGNRIGMDISISWVARICPTVAMYEGTYFAPVDHSYYIGDTYHYVFDGISMGDVWLKAAVCAGLGVVCMAIAQLLYRKRRLETAGDLLHSLPLLSGPVHSDRGRLPAPGRKAADPGGHLRVFLPALRADCRLCDGPDAAAADQPGIPLAAAGAPGGHSGGVRPVRSEHCHGRIPRYSPGT